MSDADSAATVAWTNVSGPRGRRPSRCAPRPASAAGRFGAATEVSPNGVLGGLAVTTKNHGDVHLLTWTDAPPPNAEPHPPYDVFAALRTGAAGAFDPPERVSTAALDDRGPAVAAFGARRPTGAVAGPIRPRSTRGCELQPPADQSRYS